MKPKQMLALSALTLSFMSCHRSNSPKDTTVSFMKDVYQLNFDKASAYVTNDSKNALSDYQQQHKDELSKEADKRTQAAVNDGLKQLQSDSLQETVGANTATVRNAKYNFSLTKVDDQWRIAATPELVDQIVYPTKADEAMAAQWNKVVEEYNTRTGMLQNLINYLKSNNKAPADALRLENALKQVPHTTSLNKKDISAYIEKQNNISTLADKLSSEIGYTNESMITQSIINLANQDSRITLAKEEFDKEAKKYGRDVSL